MGEDTLLSQQGAGGDVPDVASVVRRDAVRGREVAQQLAEGFQLCRGVPLEVLEAPVLLVGAVLVDVRHGLALEVGDGLAVLRGYGVELPVCVLHECAPAVQLYADGLRVELPVAEPEAGEMVVGETEVVRPVLVVEAPVQVAFAADDVGGGHPLAGMEPPRHVAVHAVARNGVMQHYLFLLCLLADVLRLREVPVLEYLYHCSLVLVGLLCRSSLLSRAALRSMMSSSASKTR